MSQSSQQALAQRSLSDARRHQSQYQYQCQGNPYTSLIIDLEWRSDVPWFEPVFQACLANTTPHMQTHTLKFNIFNTDRTVKHFFTKRLKGLKKTLKN